MLAVPTLPTPAAVSRRNQSLLGPPTIGSGSIMPSVRLGNGGVAPRELSTRQQLASYYGWNFVTVNLIARCCASIFPEVGRVKVMAEGERQNMSLSRRRLLQSAGVYVDDDQNWEVLKSHRLLNLLRRPTPEPDGTWTQFAYEVHLFWQLCGEVWIWKVPDAFGLPAALWVVPNDMIRPITTNDQRDIEYYQIDNGSGQPYKVPESQIMRGRFKSPLNKGGAFSATQAIAPWLLSSEAIDTSQFLSFSTDVHADVAVMLDKDVYPEPDKETLSMLKSIFMERASGVRNKGPLIAPPGVTEIKQLRMKPNEMDYQQSDYAIRDKVMAARAVNKFNAGISEDMNRGDTQEAQVSFWTNAGDPFNIFFGDLLTTQLATDFEEGLVVVFPSGKPEDPEQRRLDRESEFKMGAISPDEIAVECGREPMNTEESQMRYLTTSVTSLVPSEPPVDEINAAAEQMIAERDAAAQIKEAEKLKKQQPAAKDDAE